MVDAQHRRTREAGDNLPPLVHRRCRVRAESRGVAHGAYARPQWRRTESLEAARRVEEAARAVYDGISMRMLTDYLPNSDQLATRLDVLFGSKTVRGEWLVVIANRI